MIIMYYVMIIIDLYIIIHLHKQYVLKMNMYIPIMNKMVINIFHIHVQSNIHYNIMKMILLWLDVLVHVHLVLN